VPNDNDALFCEWFSPDGATETARTMTVVEGLVTTVIVECVIPAEGLGTKVIEAFVATLMASRPSSDPSTY